MISTSNEIKLLSHKISSYATSRLENLRHTNPEITGEDLQFNLCPILTDLLLELLPEPVSSIEIEEIISDYDKRYDTDFKLNDYVELGWIRLINGKYIIPYTVYANILRKNPATATPVSEEQTRKTNCLLEVYEKLSKHEKTSIDLNVANNIIQKFSPSINVLFLTDRDILRKNSAGRYYYNSSNNYLELLKNRIISLAWFKIMIDPLALADFRKFLAFIEFCGVWPDKLSDYLPYKTTRKILEFSVNLLNIEPDLLRPEHEVRNDVLDGDNFKRNKEDLEIPNYIFDQNEPYGFYQQLKYYRWYNPDLLSHHNSRSIYLLLIRLVMQLDSVGVHPDEIAIKLIKEHRNPYIRWQILDIITYTFPQLLAHFLYDQELAPLYFELVDKLELRDKWLNKDIGYEKVANTTDKVKGELWMEGYRIYLEMATHSSQPQDFGKGFAAILHYSAKKTFSFNNMNYQISSQQHNHFNKRYAQAILLLSDARMVFENYYPQPVERPLLLTYVLTEIVSALEHTPSFPPRNEFLKLNEAKFDVYIELLRYSDLDFSEHGNHLMYNREVEDLGSKITRVIFSQLLEYLTKTQLTVHTFYDETEVRKAKRGVSEFGQEILDFALVFLHFEKEKLLETLDKNFMEHLNFDLDPENHYDHDREEALKVAIYLKLLLIGYISLGKRKDHTELIAYPVRETMQKLEGMISRLTLNYKNDDQKNGKYDIFSSRRYYFSQDIYSQPLIAMLYNALNSFPKKKAESLIEEYFSDSEDLVELFTALNRIEDKGLKKILTNKIEKLDPAIFIEKAFSLTDLETVLVESVHSDTLYHFALPFLTYLEAHWKKRKASSLESRTFLYNVKLLLALKQKDTKAIREIKLPESLYDNRKINLQAEERKQFYLGLDEFHNLKNYPEAIELFKILLTKKPENVEYAFNLYQAKAFMDLNTGSRSEAKKEWDNFIKKLGESSKADLIPYSNLARSMDLLYYSWEKEDIKFDQTINTLPPLFLFREEFIPTIYENFLRRGMADGGYSFLNKAIAYFQDSGIEISIELEKLKYNAVNDSLIEKVRATLSDLRSLPPKHIPRVLPKILNDKILLEEFILGEIIAGMRVMRNKITAVEAIVHEDHFNDVFLATLRLRFPLYGWEISDQERTGTSPTGIDAGEADIVIKAAGQVLALLEALKLASGDFKKLEEHVLKCAEYSRDHSGYYIVVYYHGERTNFDSFITTYKKDIGRVEFSDQWKYDSNRGFEDLNGEYGSTENMYIAKTLHGSKNFRLYHIIIDLSKNPNPKLTKPKVKKANKKV